jgi:hypothetical protein
LKRTIQGTSLPSLIPNDLVVSEISEKIKMWHANDDGRMPCDGISLHDPFGSERSNELKVIFKMATAARYKLLCFFLHLLVIILKIIIGKNW